jgi:uncharacterized protein (TIGR02757 family)
MISPDLKEYLDESYRRFNNPDFIPGDPICIPHRFNRLQDIEISGFWIAMLAWGQRKTIINKGAELINLMDHTPYDFVLNCSDRELRRIAQFKHRTFNGTDALYFVEFFRSFYEHHTSLEEAFLPHDCEFAGMKDILSNFHRLFFNSELAPARTRKHVATPQRNSACKRINMFLRWMVRRDRHGVDFGLWKKLSPQHLICPCDLHVERTARRLGLVQRKQADWKMAVELTEKLKELDPEDPVKYDFALFGLSNVN